MAPLVGWFSRTESEEYQQKSVYVKQRRFFLVRNALPYLLSFSLYTECFVL